MKFKLNGLEFEIEGNEETVKSEFNNFQKFVSSELLNKLNVVIDQPQSTPPIGQLQNQTSIITDAQVISSSDLPILKEVVKRDLPSTEVDWVLIYSFYVSEMGEKTFTEKNLKDLYESTGRKTDNRYKKFSDNLKSLLNKGYIKAHNDTEYLLKEAGKNHAHEVLNGNFSTKTTKKNKPTTKKEIDKEVGSNDESQKKSKKAKSGNNIEFIDLQFESDKISSLTNFYESKSPKTQNEEVLVVIKWFITNLPKIDASIEEINYLLSICSKVPTALEQVLVNMKGNKFRWLTNSNDGRVKLTSIGESHVTSKLPKKVK